MRKENNGIIVVIIFLIAVTIVYFGVFAKKDKGTETENKTSFFDRFSSEKEVVDKVVKRVSSRKEFYEARNCLNKFYTYCRDLNVVKDYLEENSSEVKNDENTIEIIYHLLDQDYIERYDIKQEGLKEKLKDITADSLQIDDMYVLQRKGQVVMYFIKATELDRKKQEQTSFDTLIVIDKTKNTFSVFLEDYIKEKGYDQFKIGDKVDIELKSIYVRTDNLFDNPDYGITVYQRDIFNDFKMSCIYNPIRAYRLLDDSTRKSSFPSEDGFKSYVKSNYLSFFTMKIESCKEENENGIRRFIYTTDKEIVFTAIEEAPMKYTIVLNKGKE